jgi:hypothetical protein
MGTGVLYQGKNTVGAWCWPPHLVPRSRMSIAIHPLPLSACMVCRDIFTLLSSRSKLYWHILYDISNRILLQKHSFQANYREDIALTVSNVSKISFLYTTKVWCKTNCCTCYYSLGDMEILWGSSPNVYRQNKFLLVTHFWRLVERRYYFKITFSSSCHFYLCGSTFVTVIKVIWYWNMAFITDM